MRTIPRLISVACAALLLLGGCNGSSSSSLDTGVDVQDANGTSTDSIASGQQVNFVLTVHNGSGSPQTFNIQPCEGDNSFLVVQQGTVHVVGGGGVPQGVLQCDSVIAGGAPQTIKPGQTLSYTFVWNQMEGNQLAAPGNYSVVAGITCVNDSSACMPSSPNNLAVTELTATPYRSGPVSFTIKP